MKKIFCPKCDEEITLSLTKLRELREQERLAIVCPHCTHQLNIRRKARRETQGEEVRQDNYGHITVVENVFGYQQKFALSKGLNHIGRRNKDTKIDIPVITADPSMDRHHAIIKVNTTKAGRVVYLLADNDSRVGTFVAGNLLGEKEWYNLSEGDVFTLGATTFIFSTALLAEPESVEEVSRGH